MKRKLLVAAVASGGCLLSFLGYPALKSVYPIKKKATLVNDYLDLPTATADLTKDISLPEGVGTGTDIPVDVSHWILLSLLKSKKDVRRERALEDLARHRRWNDGECLEIAQALDKHDIIRLARTIDADIRLFLPPPSMDFIERTLESEKIDKLVKSILKDVSESSDACSSCTNFYTNLSINARPNSNALAMNELNQIDKILMHRESRKRKKSFYNDDLIRMKAVLNNVICGEKQALSMVQPKMLLALLHFRQKYSLDVQINSLLSQILANLSTLQSTKEHIFMNGWIQTLVQYSRNENLEISMPAFKALSNLDEDEIKINGIYGNHVYLLHPLYRDPNNSEEAQFDVIFVHGLVGSVFKSWRQGSIALDDSGNIITFDSSTNSNDNPPVTELTAAIEDSTIEQTMNNNNSDTTTITLITTPNKPSNGDKIKTQKLKNAKPISPASPLSPLSSSSSSSMFTKCWPKDWLPEDVPGLRILALDYPSALSNWRTDCDLNKDTLKERANLVLKQLKDANVGDRPIIWVAHSMGGLLVKQILVNCDESCKIFKKEQGLIENSKDISTDKPNDTDVISTLSNTKAAENSSRNDKNFRENILNQTKGIVFYSVPHKGSNLGWIERKNLQKLLLLTTEVIELQKSSPILLELHEKFLKLSNQNIKFLTFAEDSVSSFGVNKVVQWKGVLVHEDSLNFDKGPIFKLKIDHAHTCKPYSRTTLTYVKTVDFIKSLVPEKKPQKDEDEDLRAVISFII